MLGMESMVVRGAYDFVTGEALGGEGLWKRCFSWFASGTINVLEPVQLYTSTTCPCPTKGEHTYY